MLTVTPFAPQTIIESIYSVIQMLAGSDIFQAFVIICMAMGVIGLVLCLIGLRKYR